MGIVAEDVERTRSATDLVALISEHVALRRVGTRWVGLCPFHSEKTGSFSVNAELGRYYCFGCQANGDAISFLRETEHLDFVTAVESLASRSGIALRYDTAEHSGPAAKRSAALGEAMERAVEWYHQRLLVAKDAGGARKYLRDRGYGSDTVKHFRLGWAPAGWDVLVREAGVSADLLVDAGLAYRNQSGRLNDSFRERVLFPIFDIAGRPVGLGGRVLPGGSGPKYKNTSATALYDKSRVLYGLNWAKGAIVERGRVVVCEGYTDVIGLHRAGVTEAVATCGTALADGHVRLLTGFSRRIVLAYDADSAGQGAAEHFYDWERRFEAGISVVALPPGTDPADLAQKDPERLRQGVAEAKPFLGFRLERLFATADLANPEGRARAAEASLALIAQHPDSLVRDQYLMQVSDRCHLSPEQLRALPLQAPSKNGERAAPAVVSAAPKPKPPAVPRPELEALRLAVHHPERIEGRLDIALFSSALAGAVYA
ncbi:MAG: DNA primase, partial [Acidimicrobiales bacterium]